MKIYCFCRNALILVGLCIVFASSSNAQQSGSAASVSRSRAIVTANSYPQQQPTPSHPFYSSNSAPVSVFKVPDEVAVEEFINYHKHRLPLPKSGQSVAMDTRWGNAEVSRRNGEAVLQVGFTTAEVSERTDLRPLNLVLVIDRSGSMADSDKMSRVKESLKTMIGKLRPDDIISIVTFDTYAQLHCPAGRVGDGYALRQAIDQIRPAGSTNIHDGLMLGYREAKKNFRKGVTNRVILLTDGIANSGVTEPLQIASDSAEFNGQGIDLSTIGVGLDLNNDLLRTLAKSGRGLYHFISDYKDIDKVFVNEVQSLISSVAKRVDVRIEYGNGLQLQKLYGYSPRFDHNSVSVTLDDMNNGLTQVVMAKFRADNLRGSVPIRVRLSYFDVKRQRNVEEVQELRLTASDQDFGDMLSDVEVKKNFTIAELAGSLYDMTELAKRRDYRKAQDVIENSVATTYRRFPNMEDKDVKFILEIVEGYQRNIRSFNGSSRGNGDCGTCR